MADIRFMSDVPRTPLRWLWPGRLPAGAFCVFTGDAELGKSLILCDVTARITTGTAWPDGSLCPQGDVLICTSEDNLSTTIAPRLDAAGADSKRIQVVSKTHIAEIPLLIQTLPTLRLIAFDPLTAFMSGINTWRDDSVRSLMTPVIRTLEATHICMLGIIHWNKSQEARGLNRVHGSKAWTNVARCVWESGRLHGENQFLLRCAKLNIGASRPTPWRYTTEDRELPTGPAPRIKWLAPQDDDTFLDLSLEDRPVWTTALDILSALLHDGPVLQAIALKILRSHGVSERTAARAKKSLQVESFHVGWGPAGMWYWKLPGKLTGDPLK